jgi:hypothetical protein
VVVEHCVDVCLHERGAQGAGGSLGAAVAAEVQVRDVREGSHRRAGSHHAHVSSQWRRGDVSGTITGSGRRRVHGGRRLMGLPVSQIECLLTAILAVNNYPLEKGLEAPAAHARGRPLARSAFDANRLEAPRRLGDPGRVLPALLASERDLPRLRARDERGLGRSS